jgi:phenylacetate-CoA ligase
MEKIGVTPADLVDARSLAALPILSRSMIVNECERLKAANIAEDRFCANSTGGSSGEPLRFYDDREGSEAGNALIWRAEKWLGVELGDRRAYFWGASFDLTPFEGFVGKVRSWSTNRLMLPAWRLQQGNAEEFLQRLFRFRPQLLICYAGAAYEWARLLNFQNHHVPGLKAIILSAETLHDAWRQPIEATFGAPVFNRYGGRDIKFIAQECLAREGLHVNAEGSYVEIIRDGRPAPRGEVGEVIVTRLDNYAMPFIRYGSGDLGVWGDAICSCGRGLPLLVRIDGRVQDVILTADGMNVSGLFFAHLMKDCLDVKEFQIHQTAYDRLLIKLVTEPRGTLLSQPRIEQAIRDYMGSQMRVDFEFVDQIPSTKSGKRRITISHLNNE